MVTGCLLDRKCYRIPRDPGASWEALKAEGGKPKSEKGLTGAFHTGFRLPTACKAGRTDLCPPGTGAAGRGLSALPGFEISKLRGGDDGGVSKPGEKKARSHHLPFAAGAAQAFAALAGRTALVFAEHIGHLGRSEEHTSELQSRQYILCR